MLPHTERLVILRWSEGTESYVEYASLDVLPCMRTRDILTLVQGVAEEGDRVLYAGKRFEYTRKTLLEG